MKTIAKCFAALLLFSACVWLVRRAATAPPHPQRFEIIAHRGVYQTFSSDGVDDNTCTATRIDAPTHHYLENTLASMAAAFRSGASMVELDIHHTRDHHLVVFHDWTLDCRTNGKGVTQEQTLADLKKLDIGYGYTSDGGKTYPFRGHGIGMMPTLEEVFTAYPDKRFLINDKDNSAETVELLAAAIHALPTPQQEKILFLGSASAFEHLHRIAPETVRFFPDKTEMKQCGASLLLRLGFGPLPQACQLPAIVIPGKYLWLVPGWPNAFLQKTAAAHVPVYVMDVDTIDEYQHLVNLPINGIMTNKIDTVGKAGGAN
jgi:glycerophosphoryl diester phosphodiesterase